jgi:hypothetical protein
MGGQASALMHLVHVYVYGIAASCAWVSIKVFSSCAVGVGDEGKQRAGVQMAKSEP